MKIRCQKYFLIVMCLEDVISLFDTPVFDLTFKDTGRAFTLLLDETD